SSIDEVLFTFVLSKNNWMQLVKGHVNFSSIKYKEGDEAKFILLVKNTDKVLVASNSGRVFTLSFINMEISKGFGSPIRIFIDLPSEDSIISMNIYNENKQLLIAATNNKGFLIPNMKSLLAHTKLGKNVLEIKKDDNLIVFRTIEDHDDYIAIIGQNHKLLIFSLSELPRQSKGKGVILQKVKQGELSDAKTFKYDEGLICLTENSKKVFRDLKLWLGKRSQSGRLAPRGFPRSNRFN
ncbi:DNA topoisomerase IV subunit A, partial [Alphaproteobacteria bacterium]|nr:DNA topoisomerase IV subunit A [Alphaproteobacteria bacterium]